MSWSADVHRLREQIKSEREKDKGNWTAGAITTRIGSKT